MLTKAVKALATAVASTIATTEARLVGVSLVGRVASRLPSLMPKTLLEATSLVGGVVSGGLGLLSVSLICAVADAIKGADIRAGVGETDKKAIETTC